MPRGHPVIQQLDLMRQLHRSAGGKIVLLVMDGLGGMPIEAGGPTELEAAHSPNMDRLATEGCLGQIVPVAPGVSPGSGPAPRSSASPSVTRCCRQLTHFSGGIGAIPA